MPEPRTKLPKGLPQPLADFIRCRVERVVLEPGRLDWLPKPKSPMIPDEPPSVSFRPGEGGAVALSVGWGFVGVGLNASVVDGRLTVESDNPLLPRADLQKFLDDLNADLRDQGKAFDKVEIADGKLVMTKRLLAAAPAKTAAAVTPVIPVAPRTPATPKPGPQAAPSSAAPSESDVLGPKAPGGVRRFVQSWQGKAGITAGALALGAAAFFLFAGGDDVPGGTSSTTTTTTTAAVSPGGSPGGGTEPGGSPGEEVGALPLCDETYSEEEYAAALEALSPRLGAMPPGPFPGGPAVADPSLHIPCGGYGGPAAFDDDPVFAGIFGAGPGQVVVSHQGSVPDAVTGQTGLSMTRWAVPTNLPPGTSVFLETDCSGRTVTGGGTVTDGLAVGEGPLFQYGPCAVRRLFATPDGSEVRFAGGPIPDFVVGPEEGVLGDAFLDVAGLLASGSEGGPSHLLDAAQVVGSAFTGLPPDNESCFWFFAPDNLEAVVRALDCADTSYWVFAGFGPDGRQGAIGAGGPGIAASGLGIAGGPSGYDYEAVGGLLFANSLFPCGPGRLAFTVCASDGAAPPEGPWVLAQVVLDAPVLLAPEADLTIAVGFDLDGNAASGAAFGAGEAGGVEVEYRAAGSPDGAWVLVRHDGEQTAARALVRGNSITFVIPSAELGGDPAGYRSYALSGGAGSALPPVGTAPVMGAAVPLPLVDLGSGPGAGATTTAGAAETVADFVVAFAAAVEAADTEFLLSRLHPLVLGLYGEEACRAFVESEVLALEGYHLVSDPEGPQQGSVAGQEVPDYFTATAAFTFQGQSFDIPASFALVDGEVRWFTECR